MASQTTTRSHDRGIRRRAIGGSVIGTALEWYDFFLYGTAAALVFNTVFFPTLDPLTGTLLAFGSFAVGFVARPIGAIVFGNYGDRIGRKRILVITLMIMGISTMLIGLLPGYDTVGILAPIALTVGDHQDDRRAVIDRWRAGDGRHRLRHQQRRPRSAPRGGRAGRRASCRPGAGAAAGGRPSRSPDHGPQPW